MKKFLVSFLAVLLILPSLLYAPAEAASKQTVRIGKNRLAN
ncbi:hypothetical protein J2Y67_005610 [Neobacillus niacini]|nr:hypothetical protein [Neobacillus niacini]